jgi:hypothetical protein
MRASAPWVSGHMPMREGMSCKPRSAVPMGPPNAMTVGVRGSSVLDTNAAPDATAVFPVGAP